VDSSLTITNGQIRAAWVFPVDSPPIRNGVVQVEQGRIVAVGNWAAVGNRVTVGNRANGGVLELPDCSLLPGLVNAHTHLEFSDLRQPLAEPKTKFPDWIRRVIQFRRERDEIAELSAQKRASAVRSGLLESQDSSVCGVGEIATPGWPVDCFSSPDLACTVFLELIGLSSARLPLLQQAATDHIQTSKGQHWLPGLSPHSPYTVHPNLLEFVCRLSNEHKFPVAMHLAETLEELELLQTHRGALVDFLVDLGAWDSMAIPRGTRPLDYLQILGTSNRGLVIHGNYLTSGEIAWLGTQADRMLVVYCPRTHAYFGHHGYPLRELLGAGIRVALGTDSRASNPDLSLMNELAFVARTYPDIAPDTLLRMGTIHAAEAIGWKSIIGSLVPGKVAKFTIVPLAASPTKDAYCDLINAIQTGLLRSPRSL